MKSCDNCGKFDDCRNSTAKWSCHDYSARKPIEQLETIDSLRAEVERLKSNAIVDMQNISAHHKRAEKAEAKVRDLANDRDVLLSESNRNGRTIKKAEAQNKGLLEKLHATSAACGSLRDDKKVLREALVNLRGLF